MRKQTLSKTGRTAQNLRPSGYDIFAHQRDQSFCPRTPSFSLHLPMKGLEGPTHGISIEERPAGRPKSIGRLGPLPRDGYGAAACPMRVMPTPSRTTDPDSTRTYSIGASRTCHSSHRGNFTKPQFTFPVHEHSFIHSHACIHTFIHTFILYIQALHMQLLHHNALRRVTKR